MWSGLKGAVPILLGTYILTAGVSDAHRLYDLVIVVVAFSVIVQGGLVPTVARWTGVPMRVVDPEPWALGMGFRERPTGLHHYQVAPGSPADGMTIRALPLGESAWISIVSRDGRIVPVQSETVLRAGDEVLVLADPADVGGSRGVFEAPAVGPPEPA
jgi:cell volume regulation protein A